MKLLNLERPMNQMQHAFAKAGMTPSVVAFAAATHDLARLALNKQPDPARAIAVWLGMAAGKMFREGPLLEFLTAVAEERCATSSAESVGQRTRDPQIRPAHASADTNSAAEPGQITCAAQSVRAPSAAEHSSASARSHLGLDIQLDGAPALVDTTSGEGDGQGRIYTQRPGAAPSLETEYERGGQTSDDNQTVSAAPFVPRGPTEQQIRALTGAKEGSAALMSGVFIPSNSKGKEPFDNIRIAYYSKTKERLARDVGSNTVAYNLLRIAEMRLPANHEHMSRNTRSIDVFTAAEIRAMQRQAAVFAGHGLISLPEELRGAVLDAVGEIA